MLLDWLVREGWLIPVWWALVSLAGVAALPLCVRLLGGLPDKGYTFTRVIGMLLVGFVYWVLGIYGFLDNSVGSIVLSWLIVLVLSVSLFFRMGDRFDWRGYWRENKTPIILAEVLFFTLFALWTVYRAYQNDTYFTEKPMEIAFISGIMRSDSFPPNDPWMSGFSISYYYFGYVMAAMLSMVSNVNSGIGFSLTHSMWFALAGLSAFGVGYNLIRSRAVRQGAGMVGGVLAMAFVLLIGNFQLPLIEYPHRANIAPPAYFDFWQAQGFLDVSENDNCRAEQPTLISTPFNQPDVWNCGGWWWWHTSRVLVDYALDGSTGATQPIDEVPAFSFLLMDNHPHVLALPFVIMTIGLALNLVLLGRDPDRYETLLYGVVIGGLIFLNTWDGPIYLVVMIAADGLRRLIRHREYRLYADEWVGLLFFALKLVAIAMIAYAPFLIGFRSQAGGIIPNVVTPTLFRQYFLMFGPVLLLSMSLVLLESWRGSRLHRMNWKLGAAVSLSITGVLALLMVFMTLLAVLLPGIRSQIQVLIDQYGGFGQLLPLLLERRLMFSVLPLILTIMLGLIIARLFPRIESATAYDEGQSAYPAASGFALLLVAAAAGLTLVPEFVYLQDNFGVRINTIFKFYYQAWILFAIAGAYSVYTLLADRELPRPHDLLRGLYSAMLGFILVTGLAFIVFGVYSRTIVEPQRNRLALENQRPVTLDGRGERVPDDYYQVVLCLGDLVVGDDVVVVEASQNTYNSNYGRVGAFTGLPTVINWEGHQGQWRGATYGQVAGSRRPDVDRLYQDLRWEETLPIIERYSIDYIVYGPTERNQYGVEGEFKFEERLPVVCEAGDARIYQVTPDVQTIN